MLFSDGAFSFGKRPGFGWVAVSSDGRELARGSGICDDDGTHSVAGEECGALAALSWAAAQGFRYASLRTDLESLPVHFRRPAKNPRRHVARLYEFACRMVEFTFTVRPIKSVHPHLEAAHHLARAAVRG